MKTSAKKSLPPAVLARRYLQTLVEGRPSVIELRLAGEQPIQLTVTDGFWKQCPEVRDPRIRDWFRKQGVGYPWPGGSPPKFPVRRAAKNTFAVSRAV